MLSGGGLSVLAREDNGTTIVLVLRGNLGLRIWSQPWEGSATVERDISAFKAWVSGRMPYRTNPNPTNGIEDLVDDLIRASLTDRLGLKVSIYVTVISEEAAF